MLTPIRTITLAIAFLGVAFYWLAFLTQPLVDGAEGLSRGAFVLSALVYPDGYFLDSWTDRGRLPAAFWDRVPIMLGTAAWLGLAIGIGRPFVPSVNAKRAWSERLVALSLACLCGLALLSTMALAVGLAGGLSQRWPMLASIVCLLVICHFVVPNLPWLRAMSPHHSSERSSDTLPSKASPVPERSSATLFERIVNNSIIFATIWLGTVVMLGAWVPPSEFDVVEYHLQAPKEFTQAGRIGFVPHNIYANMPLGAEMHSLAVMTLLQDQDAWLGGLIGKSITAAISIVGAVLLGAWIARRMGSSLAGWSAAGIWLGTPGIVQVAAMGLIDGVLAVYVLATAIATCEFLKYQSHSRLELLDEITPLSIGVLAGGAAALKYPGLIYATVPCLLIVGIAMLRQVRQQGYRFALHGSLYIMMGVSLTCVPWYAKNWYLAGNPVYPLAAGIFGGKTLTTEKISQWQAAHRVPLAAAEDASSSQQFIGQGTRLLQDMGRIVWTSPYVQPAMILGVLCAIVWLRRRHPDKPSTTSTAAWWNPTLAILLAWSLWILIVWWSATHRIDRFWLPMTGLWAALAAWGLWRTRQVSRGLANSMLLSGLLYGLLIGSSSVVTDNRYFVSLAALRDDTGDTEQVPRVPLVQTWINQNLSDGQSRVLLIGEARVFEYRVDVVYSTCFDINPGETWLTQASPEQQRAALIEAGITHVMVNWMEIERYRSPGNYGFRDWPQPSHLEQLVRDRVLEPIDWGPGSDRSQLFVVRSKE